MFWKQLIVTENASCEFGSWCFFLSGDLIELHHWLDLVLASLWRLFGTWGVNAGEFLLILRCWEKCATEGSWHDTLDIDWLRYFGSIFLGIKDLFGLNKFHESFLVDHDHVFVRWTDCLMLLFLFRLDWVVETQIPWSIAEVFNFFLEFEWVVWLDVGEIFLEH